jgi:transcriptional regulator with XRE-family HTH domain
MTDYAQWIRDGLKRSGKMQTELADALGIHPSGMAKIMAGKRRIKVEELPVIAKFIGQPGPGETMQAYTGDAARVRELEEENTRLKALLADYLIKEALARK